MTSACAYSLANRFIFPAPDPSYAAHSYKRHLCWIPWNTVISPERARDDRWSDGIPCLWFPAPKAATVIMFFHANAEDLGMSFTVLKHMRDQFKVNVLAVEYPGYGLLNGMPSSEEAVYEVGLTAFRYLVDEIGVRYSQIILFGRSLGSGPAVYLAAQYPVGGLILISAFSSIRAAVQSIAGRVFAWTFKERFPNVRVIANVSCSTLFIHGGSDSLIPAEHSLRLFKRCRARKLLITPPKMEHNSNLFGDASFLAVPAIHFFGFPGYYTTNPPRLPACLFENPDRRKRAGTSADEQGARLKPWLCDCLGGSDTQHVDVTFCRPEPAEGSGVGEEHCSKGDAHMAELAASHDLDEAACGGLGKIIDDQPELRARRHFQRCSAPAGDFHAAPVAETGLALGQGRGGPCGGLAPAAGRRPELVAGTSGGPLAGLGLGYETTGPEALSEPPSGDVGPRTTARPAPVPVPGRPAPAPAVAAADVFDVDTAATADATAAVAVTAAVDIVCSAPPAASAAAAAAPSPGSQAPSAIRQGPAPAPSGDTAPSAVQPDTSTPVAAAPEEVAEKRPPVVLPEVGQAAPDEEPGI